MVPFDRLRGKPRRLSRQLRERAESHLDRFVGDPLYMDFRDQDFIDHTARQFRRAFGFDLADGRSNEVTPRVLVSLRTVRQALGEMPRGLID